MDYQANVETVLGPLSHNGIASFLIVMGVMETPPHNAVQFVTRAVFVEQEAARNRRQSARTRSNCQSGRGQFTCDVSSHTW